MWLPLKTSGLVVRTQGVRCGRSNESLAHMAARCWYVDILRAAIEHGADASNADSQEHTALCIAVIKDTAREIGLLVEAGANFEVRDSAEALPLFAMPPSGAAWQP